MSSSVQDEKSIFLRALDIDSAPERAEFLDAACSGDPQLRAAVEGLLHAHEHPPWLLRVADVPAHAGPIAERPGTVIGPYKLLQQLGEGGMGVVFMAEQTQPVRRKVALKIIKPGMDSRQVIARFEAERQALAMMDHPNIARIIDAGVIGERNQGQVVGGRWSVVGGEQAASPLARSSSSLAADALPSSSPTTDHRPLTTSSRPYFVMDLVRGVAITDFCDERQLDTRARLELFITVCQAVQHAHQKGVVHRDLKPNNILVELHDVTPVPKIIDFGVAKATNQQLTERTLFTDFAQLIGTPLYMSPEQAELSGLDIDTRSDIYSLGVLLYELLTGTTPFDRETLRKAGYDEMRRMIREEEPPRPSQRISTLDAQARSTLAQHCGHDQRRLKQMLLGELDWIVMKCLEKDRNRRYETANSLALDVRRYLNNEPVQACPPSLGYRARKFVRRNRTAVVAVSLVLLALLCGVVGTTWGMLRAQRANQEAQRRFAQMKKGAEILSAVFRDLQAAEQEDEALRVALGRRLQDAAQQLEGEAAGDPLVMATLQDDLGVSLAELGHPEQAEELLIKASQTRSRLLGTDHLDTAATTHHLAMLYRDTGQLALAQRLYNRALAVRTARLGADHPDTLTTQHYLARLYDAQGKYAGAETLFKQVIALRTARLGADHPDTLNSQHGLATVYRTQGRHALAESLCKQVLSIRIAKLGAGHLETVDSKWHLALLAHMQEKYDEAEPLYNLVLTVRTAKLGADHPTTLDVRHQLATLYEAQGKHELAESLYRELLAIRTAKLGSDHPTTLATQHSLAARYQAEENYDLAETMFKDVLTIRTVKLGPDHPDTLRSQYDLGMLYRSMKRHERSTPLFEQCLELRRAKLGADHPDTLETQAVLGASHCDAGRFSEAEPLLRECLGLAAKTEMTSEIQVSLTHAIEHLAQHYDDAGKPDEAAKWRKQLKAYSAAEGSGNL
jgi:non-specific serine/threonine protein kinase/serine/threonine-protein kinase